MLTLIPQTVQIKAMPEWMHGSCLIFTQST